MSFALRSTTASRTRSCPACGADQPSGARWCGACGAAGREPAGPVVLTEHDLAAAPVATGTDVGARRSGGLVLLLVLVVAGLVVAGPSDGAGGTTLLGRLDDHTGRASTVAPPTGLGRLWRRPVEVPVDALDRPGVHRAAELVRLGDEVLDLRGGAVVATGLPGTVPTAPVLVGGRLVTVDAVTGAVRGRVDVGFEPSGWRPSGQPRGTAAGAVLLDGRDGRLGAVEPDGTVRWVLDGGWRWDGAGAGTGWLVVTDVADRRLVVDGRDGQVVRDLGPAAVVLSPVVVDDVVAWVDPVDVGGSSLGQAVVVTGLDVVTGRSWRRTDLQPSSGTPEAIRLEAADDAVAVSYWAAGDATTAVWLEPDGRTRATVTIPGTGVTADGWPRAQVVGQSLVVGHPARDEVWAVTSTGTLRWTLPGSARVGIAAGDGVVLLRTAPAGLTSRAMLRLVDVATGQVLWRGTRAGWGEQRLVAAADEVVGVAHGCCGPAAVADWYDREHGRRRAPADLVARWDGEPGEVLLGSVAGAVTPRPVTGVGDAAVAVDGRTWVVRDGTASVPGRDVGPVRVDALVGAAGPGPLAVVDGVLVALDATGEERWRRDGLDEAATVRTDDTSVLVVERDRVALLDHDGRERWVRELDVLLQPDVAVLHGTGVLVADVTGRVLGLDLDRGVERFRARDVVASAMTTAGDVAVVGGADGHLAQLDLAAGGRLVERVRVGEEPVEDVTAVDGAVFVTIGEDLAAYGRGQAFVEVDDRVAVP